jgi:hypothetical protein
MRNKSLLEELLGTTQELLDRCIRDHDSMRDIDLEDIESQIESVEKTLEQMNGITEELLRLTGSSAEQLSKDKRRPEGIDDDAWNMIQELRQSRREALAYRRRVQTTLKALREKGIGLEGDDADVAQKARRRSFERITGRRNWRPI